MGLAHSALARYREDGFYAPIRVLDQDEAQRYRTRMEESEARLGRPLTLDERHKPHLLFDWAWELTRHPAVLDLVESIVGPDILAWESAIFTKEAGRPEHLTWHQDLLYWGLEPGDQVLTAWIALSPSTVESGCMRVVPGSHKRDLVPHLETFAPNNLLSRGQEVQVEVNEADVVDIVLQPGEMSLHHVKIIHGSEPNRARDRRIGFGIRYFPTSVRQRAKVRDSAMLVRGTDRYGHFDLEQQPAEFDSSQARGLHADLRRRRQALQASL